MYITYKEICSVQKFRIQSINLYHTNFAVSENKTTHKIITNQTKIFNFFLVHFT